MILTRAPRIYATLLIGALLISGLLMWIHIVGSTERSQNAFREGYDTCIAQTDELAAGKCLRTLAFDTSNELSTTDLEKTLSAMQSEPERSGCHEFLHYAGWSLYDKTKDFSSAFNTATELCDNGMRHGVAERFAADAAPGQDATGLVKASGAACDSRTAVGVRAACFHGIGHALMFVTDRDMSRSLSLCDEVPPPYRMACDAGVYMEVLLTKHVEQDGSEIPEAPKELFVKNMMDACALSTPAQQKTCFRYLGGAYFLAYSGKQSSFDGCGSVDASHRGDCFWGLASTFVSPGFTIAESARACELSRKFGDAAYRDCVDGGITDVVNQSHDDTGQVVEYCEHVLPAGRDHCYKTAMENLALWYENEAAYRHLCDAQTGIEIRHACETVAAMFSTFVNTEPSGGQ